MFMLCPECGEQMIMATKCDCGYDDRVDSNNITKGEEDGEEDGEEVVDNETVRQDDGNM